MQYARLQAFPPLKAEDSSELILTALSQVVAVEGCVGHKEDIRQVVTRTADDPACVTVICEFAYHVLHVLDLAFAECR